jgi:hypothetical protein
MAVSIRRSRIRRVFLTPLPALVQPTDTNSQHTLHDLFWDLGSGEYALQVLRHYGLRPRALGDLDAVNYELANLVQTFGSYTVLIQAHMSALSELGVDSESGTSSTRHRPLSLATSGLLDLALSHRVEVQNPTPLRIREMVVKLCNQAGEYLAEAAMDPEAAHPLLDEYGGLAVHYAGPALKYWRSYGQLDGRVILLGLEHQAWEHFRPHVVGVGIAAGGAAGYSLAESLDADGLEVFALTAGLAILGGLVSGTLFTQISNWFKQRHLRHLQEELKGGLTELCGIWSGNSNNSFIANLNAPAHIWRKEEARIHRVLRGPCRDLNPVESEMVRESVAVSHRIARKFQDESNSFQRGIQQNVKAGTPYIAGHLLYLNRDVVFRGFNVGHAIAKVEKSLVAVRDEVRRLNMFSAAPAT